jgi:hypothetical protein
MKKKLIQILLIIVFCTIFFSNIIFSDSNPFETEKACSDIFGSCDDASITINDTCKNDCSGNACPISGNARVINVYVNASSIFMGDTINATCRFKETSPASNNYEYAWYYNGTDWMQIANWSAPGSYNYSGINKSVIFNINSSEGTHIVRCIYSYSNFVSGSCANFTPCNNFTYDNDDVNFTVTSHLTYDFWNLTNYTTGENISSGQTFNRTNLINVSAHWTKNISFAQVEHNGTGTWINYTICSFPNCIGNWTNYTLNLSNASEFNVATIGIKTIYVNDTTSLYYNTSSPLYFNLNIFSEPNISSYWFSPSTNRTNLHTNLTIYANVSDAFGIFAVNANITYPSNISFIITNFSGDPSPGNQTWSFTFDPENITLNETGNYTVWWVKVINGGSLEKSITQNLTFFVSNNLTLNASINPTNPLLNYGYTLNIAIFDINSNYHQFPLNLTVICGGQTYNASNSNTLKNVNYSVSFSQCSSPTNYGSFDVIINATDAYNNTAQQTFTFNTVTAPPTFVPGGGGGTIPSPKTEIKNCTDGTLYNKCSSNRPLYCSNGTLISKCSVCKCESGYSCQVDETCILTKAEDFNFTTGLTNVEIEQGKDFEIKGHITNTGNTILNLLPFLNISNNCCNVSLPSTFMLNEKEEKEFTISIHVPLFTNASDYWIKIGIGTKYFNKEKLIELKVVKSSYYADLSELKSFLTDIEKEVQDYKKAGIDTRNVDNLIEKSKSILNNVNSSISKDQVNVLSGSITDLKNNINYVSTSLTLLRGQRFLSQNSWLIILLIISSILTVYFVPEVLMPLQKVDVELKKLKEDEKTAVSSRVETEKQYFTRRIDENTFTKIMIIKQDNILKLRGAIIEKEKNRKTILSRASPVEMLKWFGRGFKNLPKNIKNLFVGAYKKIKVPRISLFKKQT